MKKNYIIILSVVALLFSSCEKNAVQVIDSLPNGPFVRGYNFAVNGPSVNFYVNDTKISATNSTTGIEATTGVAYAGIFPANNNYLSLSNTGSVVFKTIIPSKASANPGVVIATVPATIEAGKYYSLFTSGVYDATAKTTSGFILEDALPAPDTSVAYVRFVNTVPNATNGFDLKAVNTTILNQVVIAPVIAYKAASGFTKVPNGVYNLTSVSANVPANYTITRNTVSFSKGFVYTIASRGSVTVAGNLGLDLTRNR
ncbi:DUF4397 domain-containing protein [Pedobacter nyackensis]|uniref:DUF4397 domain-containing protein n=1 Tax=Pedobacter nyackensis TaxID=475255 RepID=A0A1W2E4Y0_9SPHI|nr:DUF4397 domain-containing protein [Pedobacter nyackensis]SMD04843.1 protein of unknown function [Pedobacter nyackensis]